jgi:hypothetical protein
VPDRHNPDSGDSAADSEGGGLEWLQSQLGDESQTIEPERAEPAEPVVPERAEPAVTETFDHEVAEPVEAAEPDEPGLSDEFGSPVEPAVTEPDEAEEPDEADESETRVISAPAALEPAPWWTTTVQTPLVPTAEETTQLLPAQRIAAEIPEPSVPPSPDERGDSAVQRRPSGARTPGRTATALLWIAAGLLAIVVLVGLFLLGQRLGGGPTPVAAPTATQTAAPTPTPTEVPAPTGLQPAGVHAWDALGGGECLQPYTSPWEEKFTVVDCATPHAAQLVYRGELPGASARDAAFPGEAALSSQINLLCSAPGVIDLTGARAYPDVQVQGSYPVTEEQWKSGQRSYFCFVSRSSGEPLSASIAGPGPARAG